MDEKLKKEIDEMTQIEMALIWRFAPSGDPRFQGAVGKYFAERFKRLGGMTPEISKLIS